MIFVCSVSVFFHAVCVCVFAPHTCTKSASNTHSYARFHDRQSVWKHHHIKMDSLPKTELNRPHFSPYGINAKRKMIEDSSLRSTQRIFFLDRGSIIVNVFDYETTFQYFCDGVPLDAMSSIECELHAKSRPGIEYQQNIYIAKAIHHSCFCVVFGRLLAEIFEGPPLLQSTAEKKQSFHPNRRCIE